MSERPNTIPEGNLRDLQLSCDTAFTCPVRDGGECHLAALARNQAIDGAPGHVWTKFGWFNFTGGLLTSTDLYCLSPQTVQKILDAYRPKIEKREK